MLTVKYFFVLLISLTFLLYIDDVYKIVIYASYVRFSISPCMYSLAIYIALNYKGFLFSWDNFYTVYALLTFSFVTLVFVRIYVYVQFQCVES